MGLPPKINWQRASIELTAAGVWDLTAKKIWFITGCSTGFGRELAKMVLDRGYRAVVSARDPAKVEEVVVAGLPRC